MAKFRLDNDYDYDFTLIGIACHEKDYRLIWNVNRTLELNLIKEDDIILSSKTNVGISVHSSYIFTDELYHMEYKVIGNRGSVSFLIPEHKQADYFMLIDGNDDYLNTRDVINQIKKIDIVLTAFELTPEELKNKANLIFS